MLTYVLFGISYGFAAAAQPGQLQAYLISRAVSHGWRRTLPAVFAPLLSDLPVIIVVLLILTRVPPAMVSALRLAGGVFLLYLAGEAIRRWRAREGGDLHPDVPAHRTFIEAVFINLLNPNPYLGWALVLGPWLLQAWGRSPATGMALLAAFYTTLAAGYRGITWFNYYGPGYKYTPIDPAGRKTLTWVYLRDINAQVAALAPVMSRLTSTGVFFSAPAPVDGLPLLPGKLVESVACDAPVMVGEFRHADGEAYVMVVNLSLERSARFTFQAASPRETVQVISAGDGSRSDYDLKNGLWLTAGQGALLALGR